MAIIIILTKNILVGGKPILFTKMKYLIKRSEKVFLFNSLNSSKTNPVRHAQNTMRYSKPTVNLTQSIVRINQFPEKLDQTIKVLIFPTPTLKQSQILIDKPIKIETPSTGNSHNKIKGITFCTVNTQ